MKMTLEQKAPFKSISEFKKHELPAFVVVTGLNGCGKTQLLDAISEGSITCLEAPKIKDDIISLNGESISMPTPSPFDAQIAVGRFAELNQTVKEVQIRSLAVTRHRLKDAGLPPGTLDSFTNLSSYLDSSGNDKSKGLVSNELDTANAAIYQLILGGNPMTNSWYFECLSAYESAPEKFILPEITSEIYAALDKSAVHAPFHRDLSKIVGQYRAQVQTAVLHAYTKEIPPPKRDLKDLPWNRINSIFNELSLPFAIDEPDLTDTSPYSPTFRHTKTGVAVEPGQFSSGEKVIASLAMAIFNSATASPKSKWPKLLLLDEIDAVLHPAMSASLLRVLRRTLTEKHGVRVIMTTHSPSTVALASEGSVFTMTELTHELQPASKFQAIGTLLRGVPALHIDFEGRRQVFVESENDAKLYSAIYEIVRNDLNNARSLTFIGCGKKDKSTGSHEGGGCSRVKSIVSELEEGGNKSTFGLIDWDGHHGGSDRIVVFAKECRHSIESGILDPVLLIALTLRSKKGHAHKLNIPPNTVYTALKEWKQEDWAGPISKITREIVGNAEGETRLVRYKGGLELQIPAAYLELRGKDLVTGILSKFPFLKKVECEEKGLMNAIVKNVIPDHSELCPVDFDLAFEELLSREHQG